jgi:hypothetical protein
MRKLISSCCRSDKPPGPPPCGAVGRGEGGSTGCPLSLDACLREAASAKAGERGRVRVGQAKGMFKENIH